MSSADFLTELEPHIGQYAAQLNVSPKIHPEDFIFRFLIDNPTFPDQSQAVRYYFEDGRRSADKLKEVLPGLGIDVDKPFSLLEFASGYGCVTRQLANAMPAINVTACDIHTQATDFIARELGVKSVTSSNIPEELAVFGSYDVVFALSFFSHMPEITWGRWVRSLLDKVRPGGVLLFTTQGPTTGRNHFGVPELPESGFWFHADSEQKDLDTADYGQTLVSSDYVQNAIRQHPDAKLVLMHPGFWWAHQDLYGVQKL